MPQQVFGFFRGRPTAGVLVLESSELVGHYLPLLQYVDNPDLLANGDAILLIVHEECPICRDELRTFFSTENFQRKAVLVLNNQGEMAADPIGASADTLAVHLMQGVRVDVNTPTYLHLSGGVVVACRDKENGDGTVE